MRKGLVVILIALFLGLFSGQSMAQLSYGGGVFYGTYLGNLGVDLRVEYPVTENLIIAPKLDISLPNLYYGATFLTELCGHVHYKIFNEDPISLYPLAGICISSYTDFDTNPVDVDFRFRLGANIGAGGQVKLSETLSFFGEARYTIGSYHQFVGTAGVLFTPGGREEDQ